MRWVLLLILLPRVISIFPKIPPIPSASIFQYPIPNVMNPELTHSNVIKYVRHVFHDPEVDDPGPKFYGIATPIEDDAPFSDAELEELKVEYPDLHGDWNKFNHLKRGDIALEVLKGGSYNLTKIFALRRIVINETVLNTIELARKAAINGEIDFFEEMYLNSKCVDRNYPENDLVGTFYDSLYERRGKIHYVRKYFGCELQFLLGDFDDCFLSMDIIQGHELSVLANFTLRVSNGKKLKIRTWRSFVGCKKDDFEVDYYPDYKRRLEDLGISDELLAEPMIPEIRLALRRFSAGKLHEWRETLPIKITEKAADIQTQDDNDDFKAQASYLDEKQEEKLKNNT
uniref:Decapping nuclease n=2 Tax=Caenorhabditis japonica TaxID=281687 RepID=A0A8R1DFG1_CAEJA